MKTKHAMRFFEEAGAEGGSLLADPPAQQQQEHQTEGDFQWTGKDGTFGDGWISRLPESLKPAAETLEKYKSLPELATAHFNLQTLLGKKANAILPINETSKPEEIAAFRKALGIPDKADGYNLKPEKLPDGVGWNDDNGKALAELALKHNVPPAAMKELVGFLLDGRSKEHQAAALAANQETVRTNQANVKSLQDLWKGDFDKNIQLARRAAITAGADPNHASFADPEIVKAFARVGAMISEDKLVRGDAGGEGHFNSPGAMAKDIMTNKENPMYARYHSGDKDVIDHVRALNRRQSGE